MPTKHYNAQATERLKQFIDMPNEIDQKAETTIRELLEAGADPTVRQQFTDNSILIFAILSNRLELARDLIELYKREAPEALDFRDILPQAGNTALMLCIKKGFYREAVLLLEAGADPNIVSDIDDLTPLHLACGLFGTHTQPLPRSFLNRAMPENYIKREEELVDLIKLLIKHGANTQAKTTWGTTPLELLMKEFTPLDMLYFKENRIPLGVFLQFPEGLVREYERRFLTNYPLREYDIPEPITKNLPEKFHALHQLYLQYAAYRKELIGKNGDEYDRINEHMQDKRLVDYSSKQMPMLSVQNIYDRAKTDPRYGHLTSLNEIYAECTNPDGLFSQPFASISMGHASGMNDLMSLLASTTWHRKLFNKENFLINRNQFLQTGYAKSTIDGLQALAKMDIRLRAK